MTNEQILKKAIEKAVKGGYEFNIGNWKLKNWEIIKGTNELLIAITATNGCGENKSCIQTIFDHNFAKAFWGEEIKVCSTCGAKWGKCKNAYYRTRGGWKYHLQQMVLKKDPILYLKRFLDE